MEAVALSPGGTRWLTRRTVGNGDVDDDDAYTTQFTTGDVAPNTKPYTVTALDAALPNENQMLVLTATGDSLELRMEGVYADSASRILWRRSFAALYTPTLRLLDGGTRWQVSGIKRDTGTQGSLVTLDGALDGADSRRTEVDADTLHGQSVFTYRDGSRLVMSLARNPVLATRRRSVLWTTLVALRGINITWQLSRHDRGGVHPLTSLHGAVRCWPAAEDDIALCVDQGVRGVHVLSIARNGSIIDLGMLSHRYQRASASPQGQLVASSYTDRSLAIIDVARRRALRITLPETSDSFTRDATATSNAVAVILSGNGGPRLMVYRLGSPVETAATLGTNRVTSP
jgi:hypothetical protein